MRAIPITDMFLRERYCLFTESPEEVAIVQRSLKELLPSFQEPVSAQEAQWMQRRLADETCREPRPDIYPVKDMSPDLVFWSRAVG